VYRILFSISSHTIGNISMFKLRLFSDTTVLFEILINRFSLRELVKLLSESEPSEKSLDSYSSADLCNQLDNLFFA
jgi:hypothetical protein